MLWMASARGRVGGRTARDFAVRNANSGTQTTTRTRDDNKATHQGRGDIIPVTLDFHSTREHSAPEQVGIVTGDVATRECVGKDETRDDGGGA